MFKNSLFAAICFCLLSNTPLLAACGDKNSEFLAAVVKVDDSIEVWINTRKHWMKEGSLTDSYSSLESKKVDKITDLVNLCNLAESTYEPCRDGRSVQQIKADLKKACVQVDSSFQRWAENEVR